MRKHLVNPVSKAQAHKTKQNQTEIKWKSQQQQQRIQQDARVREKNIKEGGNSHHIPNHWNQIN